jgi:monovalent cation:H+ antiporter-2, CPA2 family
MALGAFVIALMLAETAYGKAIQTAIDPLKGLLLGVFFFTVGMKIDFREFAREPVWLISVVIGLIVFKSAVLAGLAKAFRIPWRAAIETGLLLGPGGEFASVSIGLASGLQLVQAPIASFTLAATALTMALTPLLSVAAKRLIPAQPTPPPSEAYLTIPPPPSKGHAIVVGYGRVGKVVCSMLKEHGVRFVAIDDDALGVARDRRHCHLVYYGDASDPKFLEVSGLGQANGVIITINIQRIIDLIVERVRTVRPDILIVSRARDEAHASHLYSVGVTDAVPETVEASFQLSEAALVGLGIPTGPVIASIHERRDEFRRTLQRAAKQAGRDEIHSVRAKTQLPP